MNQITFKATGLDITEALRLYAYRRLEGFVTRYPILNDSIQVELGKSSRHHKNGSFYFAEAYFKTPSKKIYAKAKESDLYAAIDKLHSELQKQLEVTKGKKIALFKRGAQKIKKIIKLDFS